MAGLSTASWGELRCAECIRVGRYSKILLQFVIGSVADGGEIAVRCKCGQMEKLTPVNQYCDQVRTFRSELATRRVS